MNIIINGKQAVLKEGSSFEFVSENRAFTGSDSYTLSITFPLRGCLDNIAIFGNINRTDVEKSKVVFDCQIQSGNFLRTGIITIVEISDKEVKTQFLEGRSEQNFADTFDEVFINELDLGEYPSSSLSSNPASQWMGIDEGQEFVSLPWVNNASGIIQNEVTYSNGTYSYHSNCRGLSFQPYLIAIVKRLCSALGYSCDVSQWENDRVMRYLLICNSIPYSLYITDVATALPHWSVTEFFEKLELFLDGEFDVNHKDKSIKFSFTSSILTSTLPTLIENIVDNYSVEVTAIDESNYVVASNVSFKECNHNMWKFYCCPWFLTNPNPLIYDTLAELIEKNKRYANVLNYYRGDNIHRIFYAKDVDTYFIIRCIRTEYVQTRPSGLEEYNKVCVLQPINVFGDKIVNEDSENNIVLDFVPAWIDETETSKGDCLFVEMTFNETDTPNHDSPDATNSSKVIQPSAMQSLLRGEITERTEYYDRIYLAFWDGRIHNVGKLPCPVNDSVVIYENWDYYISPYSMRLNKNLSNHGRYKINPKQKFHFSFLSDSIPNVRSLFYINGRMYLCEKITATVSENGMSQLLKGNFYLVIE